MVPNHVKVILTFKSKYSVCTHLELDVQLSLWWMDLNCVIIYALVPWLHINVHDTWEKDFELNKPCLWSNQEVYADITLSHHLCLEEWWEQENRVWHQLLGFYMQIILPSTYDSLYAWLRLNANLNCCLKQCVLWSKTFRASNAEQCRAVLSPYILQLCPHPMLEVLSELSDLSVAAIAGVTKQLLLLYSANLVPL